MKTISQFFEDAYSRHLTSSRREETGTWSMYRHTPATGRLTKVDFRRYPTTPCTSDFLLVFGWLNEQPAGVEDLVTLAANGAISLYQPDSFKATPEAAPEADTTPAQADPIAESRDITARAASLRVTNQTSFELAGETVKDIKRIAKEVGRVFDPIVEKAHQAHREAIAQRDQFLAPLKTAEAAVKSEMIGWQQAEQRRINEENRRREAARIEAEREAIEAAEAERAELIAQAEEHGNTSMMNELANAVLTITPVIPVLNKIEVPKMAGVAVRTTYRAEVTDIVALIRAAAEKPEIYAVFLMPNMTSLNIVARDPQRTRWYLGNAYDVPGVRFVSEQKMAVRT